MYGNIRYNKEDIIEFVGVASEAKKFQEMDLRSSCKIAKL